MKLTKYEALDIASTVAAGVVLYMCDAPWWTYVAMLAFGFAQRLIGKEQGSTGA